MDSALDAVAKSLIGVHRVTRVLADGQRAIYYYAWRGGPRLACSTPQQLRQSYNVAHARADRQKPKRPRRSALELSKKEFIARHEICGNALRNARHRSTKKGIEFAITHKDIVEMARLQCWRCALSGIEFNPLYDIDRQHTYNPLGISVDRVDSRRGYVPGNVRLVLTAVNFGLNDWGEEMYLRIAKAVVEKANAIRERE